MKKKSKRSSRNFLHQIDQCVLIHLPSIWRFKIHITFGLSILVSSFAYWIGTSLKLDLNQFATLQQIEEIQAYFSLFATIIGLLQIYWIFDFTPRELFKSSPKNIKNFSLIYLNLILIFLPVFIIKVPIIDRIAKLIPDLEFQKEYNFHQKNDFWCSSNSALLFENSDSVRIHILKSFNEFGLETPIATGFTDGQGNAFSKKIFESQYIGPDSTKYKPCLFFGLNKLDSLGKDGNLVRRPRTEGESILPPNIELFQDKLKSIFVAKQYGDKKSHWNDLLRLSLILLGIEIIVIIVIYIARFFEKSREPAMLIERTFDLNKLPYFSTIDNYLLLNHKILWASQFHKALLFLFVFFIPVCFLYYGYLLLSYKLDASPSSSVEVTTFLFFIFLAIFLESIYYSYHVSVAINYEAFSQKDFMSLVILIYTIHWIYLFVILTITGMILGWEYYYHLILYSNLYLAFVLSVISTYIFNNTLKKGKKNLDASFLSITPMVVISFLLFFLQPRFRLIIPSDSTGFRLLFFVFNGILFLIIHLMMTRILLDRRVISFLYPNVKI